MIPKIIHYCWFGEKEKDTQTKTYIDKWKEVLFDYMFTEWNESNFDLTSQNTPEYVKEAYRLKKWAFVSDYVRLYALYNFGGIYLDTDVEVLKKFDSLLENTVFFGAESEFSLCTATIGAVSKNEFILRLMHLYDNKKFLGSDGSIDKTPNSQLLYSFVKQDGYCYSEDIFRGDSYVIYPSDYFFPINCYTHRECRTKNTYSIHHYAGTWKSSREKNKDEIVARLTSIIGEKNRERIKRVIKHRKE